MTDLEAAQLDDLTLVGGWRLLCVSAMHHCVKTFVEDRRISSRNFQSKYKNPRERKSEAERWLDGGVGTITFEDACDVLDIRPEVARQKIEDYALKNRRKSTNELFSEW
jgi:hypothetical protein